MKTHNGRNRQTGGAAVPPGNDLFNTNGVFLFSLLAFVGPYLVLGFFIILSIFNSNIKGIVYLIGFIVLYSLFNTMNLNSSVSAASGSIGAAGGAAGGGGGGSIDAAGGAAGGGGGGSIGAAGDAAGGGGGGSIGAAGGAAGDGGIGDAATPTAGGTGASGDNCEYKNPLGVLVYGYTFSYLLFPMIQFNMMNYPLLVSLLCFIGIDVAYLKKRKCFNAALFGIALSVSFLVGFFWSLFVSRLSPSILYSTDYLSDKQVCSIPSEQTFKCKVYKNGELISTMTR
jgi:hypothetical protein